MLAAALALAAWGVSAAPPPPPPAPQVLVSVQYGPRDGLLVAQYRAPAPQAPARRPQDASGWPQQRKICSDLCASGLGGLACGQSCTDITPSALIHLSRERSEMSFLDKIVDAQANQHAGSFHVNFPEKDQVKGANGRSPGRPGTADRNGSGLENELDSNITATPSPGADLPERAYSNAPRTEVCPTLCTNDLGWPLCECSASPPNKMAWAGPGGQGAEPRWGDVCASFCPLTIRGCAPCKNLTEGFADNVLFAGQEGSRILDTPSGWIEWCAYQCSRGEGGAACNCDRAPFF